MDRERESSRLTQILFSPRLLRQVRETDVELKEGCVGGGEHFGKRTNDLGPLNGIVQPAPFSHYTVVCLCVCVISKIE